MFDAAAKYRGTSLNENLLKDPDLLSSLGDIEQMLHQVNVTTTDRDALRFLWRDNVEHPVEDYIMNVQLFGKKDSLCLANGFLNKQC